MKYFIIIISLIAIIACEEENSNSANNKDYSEYFPLEVGNWWIYEHETRTINRFQKIETTALKTINNKVYTEFSDYYLDSNENVISVNQPKYYRFENNKVFILEDIDGEECKIFDFNIQWPDSVGYLHRDFFFEVILMDSSFCFESGSAIKLGSSYKDRILNKEIDLHHMASYGNQPHWKLGKNIGICSYTSLYPHLQKLIKSNLIGD